MFLPFIADDDLIRETKRVIDTIINARKKPDHVVFKNVVDPFSALFDASIQEITLDDWLSQERNRQIQKTFQNAVGQFHQNIIGAMPGWKSLPTGGLIDVENQSKKIIAEIKNKYNTTKGSDKIRVYDNLKSALEKTEYKGAIGYYVEIIPKSKKPYNYPFTPPDNTTHSRRESNDNIRIISGPAFYDLASGYSNSLRALYETLPQVIAVILGIEAEIRLSDTTSQDIFDKAF